MQNGSIFSRVVQLLYCNGTIPMLVQGLLSAWLTRVSYQSLDTRYSRRCIFWMELITTPLNSCTAMESLPVVAGVKRFANDRVYIG